MYSTQPLYMWLAFQLSLRTTLLVFSLASDDQVKLEAERAARENVEKRLLETEKELTSMKFDLSQVQQSEQRLRSEAKQETEKVQLQTDGIKCFSLIRWTIISY